MTNRPDFFSHPIQNTYGESRQLLQWLTTWNKECHAHMAFISIFPTSRGCDSFPLVALIFSWLNSHMYMADLHFILHVSDQFRYESPSACVQRYAL